MGMLFSAPETQLSEIVKLCKSIGSLERAISSPKQQIVMHVDNNKTIDEASQGWTNFSCISAEASSAIIVVVCFHAGAWNDFFVFPKLRPIHHVQSSFAPQRSRSVDELSQTAHKRRRSFRSW